MAEEQRSPHLRREKENWERGGAMESEEIWCFENQETQTGSKAAEEVNKKGKEI